MNVFYRLRAVAILLTVVMLNPGPELFAKKHKGDKFYKLGQIAEGRKQYEEALDYYDKALKEDPSDPAYNLSSRRMHVQVGLKHMDAAKKLRESGQLEQAASEYQKAFNLDPSN